MIVVRFRGGLGNQMFQYAAAKGLAHRHKTQLYFDFSQPLVLGSQDTPRHYELDSFKLKKQLLDISHYNLIQYGLGRKGKLLSKVRNIGTKSLVFYQSSSNLFEDTFLTLPDNTLLEGWFTSEKYFEDIRDVLLKDFSYKKEPNKKNSNTLRQIQSANSVSIHIRRGDYVSNKNAAKWHGILGLGYYQNAIKRIASQVSTPKFFVFSNDPEWCKKNLKTNFPTTYVDNNDDVNNGAEDMRLMQACKHNIIANSTFSWWGAWLNENSNKTVVAPEKWFQGKAADSADIIPREWIRL